MNRCQYSYFNNAYKNADLMISSMHPAELMETLLDHISRGHLRSQVAAEPQPQ